MPNDDEIVQGIKRSFLPLRCEAEIWDDGAQLHYRVFNKLDQALRTRNLNIGQARNGPTLRGILEIDRAWLERKGHKLGPWP